ncbi:glycosyltransferase [Bowmanella yangjiangensis]|uniref:Glycosyltransferase n=2 Tax=Gammaproteobacteria TaxID=1236 RepID=A0ABS3D0Y8_9ALTE|nr:glycosyltransferase [Bowmanella yangjiangensis]MBN7822250.1 glycosyltransferase [Bowmanella yangjiangensis]
MRCASITVTFSPDPVLVVTQLRALPDDWLRLVVDNGTSDDEWALIEPAIANLPGVEVMRLGANLGLAAAQNRGMEYLAGRGDCTHVLLLDQDSEPLQGSASALADAHSALVARGYPVGAVGPTLRDPVSGVQHGFHQVVGWRWARVNPVDGAPVPCECLNGSGTFMALELALSLAGMDEGLFIDHVDTEWSFRLLASGHRLYGVPEASFLHRMGDRTTRLWLFGWRVWPVRSPSRHRYLFRNAVLLLGRSYVPPIWKAWAVVKLGLTVVVFALAGPQRLAQLGNMVAGVRDGVLGRSGAL